MLENHLLGSATGAVKGRDVPGDGSTRVFRSGPMRQPSPEKVKLLPPATTAASAIDRQPTGFWSLLISSLMEGLAFYGASVHSVAFIPTEPHPGEQQRPAPRDIAVRRWRGPIRVISSTEPRDTGSTRFDRDADRVVSAGSKAAFETRSKREREIQKAAAALARLDDGTLLNLGIPHRSYIEETVRYCHDC
jgi:hypothetical protein